MGVNIINNNPQDLKVSNWAVINDNIVVNTIVADINFINNISQFYQYLVNLDHFIGQPISGNWTYNAQQNTFSPPIVDPVAILQNDFGEILVTMRVYIPDANLATSNQIRTAVTNFINQNTLTPSEVLLWSAIQTYYLAGGN